MSRVDSREHRPNIWMWVMVALVILIVGILRLRLLAMPLERDEGEYAYIGQLLLQGVAPFKLAYTLKLPGTAAVYAVIMALFGQTPSAIHFGLLIVNAVTILLVFLLGKKLLGPFGGVTACATYAVMSLSYSVLGLAAHATHFVVFFAVAGVMLFLHALESGRLIKFFLSGLLFGTAFLMKQPGILLSLFGFVLVVWFEIKTLQTLRETRALGFKKPKFNWKRCAERLLAFGAAVCLPFAITCLILWRAGVFNEFLFWIFTYSSAYGSRMSGAHGLDLLLEYFLVHAGIDVLLWLLAIAGLLMMPFDKKSGDRKFILLTLFIVSFISVCPGLYFRQHYFVLALPAVSLLVGYAALCLQNLLRQAAFSPAVRAIPTCVLSVILLLVIFGGLQKDVLFKDSPAAACSALFGSENPFAESPEIAAYIRDHTTKDQQVAILGSEPQICFYAHRRSVTGYIYTYGLVEDNSPSEKMQNEMIREIEAGKPEMMVVVELPMSWLATKDPTMTIFNWMQKYPVENYDVVGRIDFSSDGPSKSHWGADAGKFEVGRDECVFILKRKGSATQTADGRSAPAL